VITEAHILYVCLQALSMTTLQSRWARHGTNWRNKMRWTWTFGQALLTTTSRRHLATRGSS